MPNSRPSLSVAIVYYDSPLAELATLLCTLATSIAKVRTRLDPGKVDVFVVNNSESVTLNTGSLCDDSAALEKELKKQHIHLSIIQGQGNVGYGSAHNLVLDRLRSRFHLMMNPDVRLEENSLSAGLSFLLDNPQVVLLSPHAVNADGERQFLCKRYPAVLTLLVRGFFPTGLKKLFKKRLARYEMHDLSPHSPGRHIPICSGCFMLCRTDMLQAASGFDPNYFLYFEDFDLSLRLAQQAELAYLPAMKIEHDGGHAAKKGWRHIKLFVQSARRFFATHGWRWVRQP